MRVHMRAEIAQLNRRLGATFVDVTHDQAEAMTMPDRIAVMMEGEILQVGAPAELRAAQFIGSPAINILPAETGFDAAGYHQAMLEPSTFGGQVYGLPFSVSTPIGFYNMDILRAAGIETVPQSWDQVIDACRAIRATGRQDALFRHWNISGNWLLQAAMLTSASDDPEVRRAASEFIRFITSGEGAAAVALTTGYIPPNRAANALLMDSFYAQNPNKLTAVNQLPLLSEWFAYPGDNGLAVTQLIDDSLESILTGDATDMEALRDDMVEEANGLLPH